MPPSLLTRCSLPALICPSDVTQSPSACNVTIRWRYVIVDIILPADVEKVVRVFNNVELRLAGEMHAKKVG